MKFTLSVVPLAILASTVAAQGGGQYPGYNPSQGQGQGGGQYNQYQQGMGPMGPLPNNRWPSISPQARILRVFSSSPGRFQEPET